MVNKIQLVHKEDVARCSYEDEKISLVSMNGKRGNLNIQGIVFSIIVGLLGIVIIFGMFKGVIPVAATSYHNFTDTMKAKTDVLGTDAATFAGTTDDHLGWLWVAGPLLLAIGLIFGFMKLRSGGGYRRSYRRYRR